MRRLVHLLQFSLSKDAETVRLENFLFAFRRFHFPRRHWRRCGSSRDVHVHKGHFLHKLLHRGLAKSGSTVHTLNIPPVMVPFSKARELPKGSDSNQKS